MPFSLLRVAPLILCVTAIPVRAQRALEARAQVDSTDVRIGYDPVPAGDDREIDRRLTARAAWTIGNDRGAVLTMSRAVRFGTTIIPPGRHLLQLQRDRNGTWLGLRPVDDRDAPIRNAATWRIPLEVERDDSVAPELEIRLESVRGTAETIIFSYDTTSRHTDRDVYGIATEANRGHTRLVIAWGHWRWGLPLTAAAPPVPGRPGPEG